MMNDRLRRLLCLVLSLVLLALPMVGQASMFSVLMAEEELVNQALAPVLESRVRDEAGLLTPEQQREVAQRIYDFQQATGMDFLLITTQKGIGGLDAETYVETYYHNGYGLDAQQSGIAYFIDMDKGYHLLTAFGRMEEVMTQERLEYAVNRSSDMLSESCYDVAVLDMIHVAELFYLQDYPAETPPPQPTPLTTGDVDLPEVASGSPISELPAVSSILLFLATIVSTVFSVLTQF